MKSERQIFYNITHIIKDTNEFISKTETDLQIWKTWGEGINQELEMNTHTLLHIR